MLNVATRSRRCTYPYRQPAQSSVRSRVLAYVLRAWLTGSSLALIFDKSNAPSSSQQLYKLQANISTRVRFLVFTLSVCHHPPSHILPTSTPSTDMPPRQHKSTPKASKPSSLPAVPGRRTRARYAVAVAWFSMSDDL